MRYLMMILATFALLSCGKPSKFKTYNGPEVTQVLVDKTARKMWLLHGTKALKEYDVDLGFAPKGHKFKEGDGRTPEGVYRIDRRNPNSAFHLSIGISYPNNADRAKARAAGVSPGGDIFIHGGPVLFADKNKADWTAGCISVTNKEMEEIYAMVKDGTPILIKP
ncbi:L,D-transpeptidase family protein [Amylibacter sp. IMCC11727]|uniref:L,D-transpeptidase family protein n=1 Tax=Amylibacter sp. IMCC11727 TaxID=3039851 RepID=UPI00244DF1BE|nr:L,D-transpeptidase family protein [Amylibacter sp. IMCC11727]WGI22164.1 L,D-transpeptidase family protein [Amylibacter sp. IMCC11727]